METQTQASVWHQVTRLLAGLLEIINIIACVPIAAFAYVGMLERLQEFEPALDMAAITGLAIFGAMTAVAVVNGGIAVLLCIKHDIRQGLEQQQGQQQQNIAAPQPETMPPPKAKTPKKRQYKKRQSKIAKKRN